MRLSTLALASLVAVSSAPMLAGAQPFYGFGSGATGGAGKPTFVVTNLNDSGAGSFRAALASAASSGGGVITFQVGGTITPQSSLAVPDNTTIAGGTAPSPGITLCGTQIGNSGTLTIFRSNVIVQHLRIREAGNDAIMIASKNGGSISQIVVDHCSLTNSDDGGIDVTGCFGMSPSGCQPSYRVSDVTLSNNYFAGNGTGSNGGASLNRYGVANLSFYYNFWDKTLRRNPTVYGGGFTPYSIFDIRYSFIRNAQQSGIQVREGARTNIVGNFKVGSATFVSRDGSSFVYSQGNTPAVSGNVSVPFPVPNLPMPASQAAITANAGALPRDAVDTWYVNTATTYSQVRNMPGCP